jgi:hypothetical protein
MMDPISAFALAASVINVVDYGTRVLSSTRNIYTSASGQKSRHVELSTLAQELSGLSTELERRIAKAGGQPGNCDIALLDICRRCLDTAGQLQNALDDLQAKGTTKVGAAASSLVAALKAIWSEPKIQSLMDSLCEIRHQMIVASLASVW